MIQAESWLTPIDNSGARAVECIRALGGFHRAFASPGDRLVVSVKRLRRTGTRKVQAGEVHLALLVRTRFPTRFRDGTSSRAEGNRVLLINRKGRILGTRLFG
jgi:large subunit ribosomal protein L14